MSLLWRLRKHLLGTGIVRDPLSTGYARRALLLYTVYPFRVRGSGSPHQNVWQVGEIVRALAELRFAADVVEYDERRQDLLRPPYHLVIDLHPRETALYDGCLTAGARTIAYIGGNDPNFSNAAERERLADLESRRGVRLAPRRQVPPFPRVRLEAFDALFHFGGGSTLATFRGYQLPPLHRLPNNGCEAEPTDPARRDPRRFLFLGGTGQVHKGLDLLLERFAAESDLELWVCSPFAAERDFARAYQPELRRRPNIRAVGFVDVRSGKFRDLQSRCGTMILPSCSEAESGSVTAALAYGLPCAVGPNCGFDDPEVDVLPDCCPGTIERFVRDRAAESPANLERRARESLALARRRLRPADYAEALRRALHAVLAGEPVGEAR